MSFAESSSGSLGADEMTVQYGSMQIGQEGDSAEQQLRSECELMWEDLHKVTLSLLRVINVKFSPPASPEILHHAVRRTWLFIADSDENRLYYKFSLHLTYTFSL